MNSHINQLKKHIPSLLEMSMLDLGAGKGRFLIDVTKAKGKICGIELNSDYIETALMSAQKEGVSLDIVQGVAENLPFPDQYFDFVNISEVIEHVENPDVVLSEVFRVLKEGGKSYISIPNRYGFYDQHFHLYFVNWLPRKWSDKFISIFSKHKKYSNEAGRQRLGEMHYFSWKKVMKLVVERGFVAEDIRMKKIKSQNILFSIMFIPIYLVLRRFFLNSFHLLLTKPAPQVGGKHPERF